MDLGEYFTKVFGKIFNKDVYWPTFVLSIIYGILFVAIFLIGFFSMDGLTLFTSFNGTTDPMMMQSNLENFVNGLSVGLFLLIGLLMLIGMYLGYVFYVFVISRVQLTEKKKAIGFFEGFGRSFGKGFKLFIASIIFIITMMLLFAVIWLIFIWIPILGWIIGFLLSICLYIYFMVGMLILTGKIGSGESFGSALGQAYTKPFSNFKLVGFALLFGILIMGVSLVIGLLMLIPFLGLLLMLFFGPAVTIYYCALAYYFAQEK